jgi:hypothetical protein
MINSITAIYNQLPMNRLFGNHLHHFVGLTFKKKYPPFSDGANLIALNRKWDADTINPLMASGGLRVKRPVPLAE